METFDKMKYCESSDEVAKFLSENPDVKDYRIRMMVKSGKKIYIVMYS